MGAEHPTGPRARTARGQSAAAAQQPRRSWQQDPEGRRERILNAAEREFAEHGIRNARLERVAAAADVAEGTVYHQFGSKQGLLAAVGTRYGEGLVAAAFGPADPAFSTAAEIERTVRNVFDFVRETEGPLAVFLLSMDPLEGGPAEEANRAQVVAALEARLGQQAAEGLIPRPPDIRVMAEIQFALVESALRDCFLRHSGKREETYIREVSRCMVAYVGAPGGEADAPGASPTEEE